LAGYGHYSVTIFDGHCSYTSNTIHIDTFATPIIPLGNDTTICAGTCAGFVVAADYDSYLWMNGSTNTSVTVCHDTNVAYTAIDAHGCINHSDTLHVRLQALPRALLPDSITLCQGSSTTLDAGNAGATYHWSPGGQTTQSISVSSPGSYAVTVSENGCDTVDASIAVLRPSPIVDTNFSDYSMCCGTLQLHAGANDGTQYHWGNGQSTNTLNIIASGSYAVTATNTFGCKDSNTYHIQIICISPDASADPTVIDAGGTSNLTVTASSNQSGYRFSWDPSSATVFSTASATATTALDSSITFGVTVTYPYPVSNGDTCSERDTVTVNVLNIPFYVFPDAFTPNKDGLNDYFYPVMNQAVNLKSLKIFNRWGQLVYSESNRPGWDGTFGGNDQPVGTYVYYTTLEVPDKSAGSLRKYVIKQGSFSLIR
jgi:gliding motility-associated-like protein